MKTLRVGFSKPKSKWAVLSYLIRFVENTSYSHAFLRWSSASLDRELIYQASRSFVHFVSGDNFDAIEDTMALYEIDVTDAQFNQVVQKAVDLAGTSYGLLELFGIAISMLFKVKNPFKDGDKTFVCSELVGVLLEIVEGPLFADLESSGPKELEDRVSKLPGIRKVQ